MSRHPTVLMSNFNQSTKLRHRTPLSSVSCYLTTDRLSSTGNGTNENLPIILVHLRTNKFYRFFYFFNKKILAIILTGEPARWESSLQLLVDLLMTDGKPDEVPETFPEEHLPIIACNMDLVYMDKAALPRFGHGAFLICLQTLYNQLTGYKLRYTSLLGKPSEITFRFAEHILTLTSKRMGYKRPIDPGKIQRLCFDLFSIRLSDVPSSCVLNFTVSHISSIFACTCNIINISRGFVQNHVC
ncbi:unnamed protein product [Schistosoma margrebowiei]|uniref:Uncharacterized protein n=1 Tax=Schistosoma margrebowiei TaxID=48269 RepID=A0A3P8E1Y7_9TREM|nr:unnamed protein product [Schistosoma margrebowiei]